MENLTGGTPPVRPLPCVVPCKLYFLFVQTHAPLDIGKQHTMCLLLCCLVFNICECGFQRGKVVLMLVNDLQNHITLHIIGHKL